MHLIIIIAINICYCLLIIFNVIMKQERKAETQWKPTITTPYPHILPALIEEQMCGHYKVKQWK